MEGEDDVAFPFIQLVNGKFEVDKQAAAALSAVKGKLAVVCVAGPYRTGKSFLLNRLIGRQNGFKVGGSVNSCTKGIWLWGEGVREEGSEFRTIFLDSEGLGSIEQSATFDVQIFSLSLLLSSLFVLNTQGTINESALEQLELVVECTRAIQAQDGKVETADEEYRGGDLAPHFPDFLWVLRDFMLELSDTSGGSMSSRQYLEKCLEDLPGNRKRGNEKNRLRQTLRTVFARRDCDTLVRPVHDERQLQKLHELPYESLRKEFRDQMEALRMKVLRSAPAKAVDGVFVNGAALVKLAGAYCQALNSGGVPVVRSAWQSVVEMQMRDGMEAALAWYDKRLQQAFELEKTCFSQEDLDLLLQKVESESINLILEHVVGEEELKQTTIQSFRTKIQASKIACLNMNIARARILARQCIEQAWKESGLEAKIQSEAIGEVFFEDVEVLISRSLATMPGPAVVKEQICRLFLQYVLGVLSRALSKQQQSCSGLKDDVASLEATLAEANESRAREREDHLGEVAKLKAEVGFVSGKLQQEEGERKRLEVALSSANASLLQAETARAELMTKLTFEQANLKQAATEAAHKKEKWHMKFGQLNDALNASREQTKTVEAALEKAKTQFHAEIDVLKQTAESTNQALQDANMYITELEAQAKDREAELLGAEGKFTEADLATKKTTAELIALREERASLEARLAKAEAKSLAIQQELENAKSKATEAEEKTKAQLQELELRRTQQTQDHERDRSAVAAQVKLLEKKCEELQTSLATAHHVTAESEAKKRELQAAELSRGMEIMEELRDAEHKAQCKIIDLEAANKQQQQKLNSIALENQETLKQERLKTAEARAQVQLLETTTKQAEAKLENALSHSRERCAEFERLNATLRQEMGTLRGEVGRQPSSLSLQIGEDMASLSRLQQELEVETARNSASYRSLQDKLARCKSIIPLTKRALSAPDTNAFKVPKTRQQLHDDKENVCIVSRARNPAASPVSPQDPGIKQVNAWLTSPSRQV